MANNSSPGREWKRMLAPAAVCFYVLAFAAPTQLDVALLGLATLGGLAALATTHLFNDRSSILHWAVFAFLSVQVITTVISADRTRSFTVGLAVLPGVAIFFLIADYFSEDRMLRWTFVTHSLLALCLGAAVLLTLWRMEWVILPGYQNWVAEIGTPILIVSNDTIFLSLLAPLSAAVLLTKRPLSHKTIAWLSLVSTVILAGLMQSRMMAGLLLLTLALMTLLLAPRLAAPAGAGVLAIVLLIDAFRGLPLFRRFAELYNSGESQWWDARIPIWQAAWNMFLEHPFMGAGLHTFRYVSVDNIEVGWVHNLYLETLAEQGLLGFTALAGLLGSMLWMAIENFKRATGERRIFAAALVSVVVGVLFGGIFEISFVRQWVNELVFFAAGAAVLQRRLLTDADAN